MSLHDKARDQVAQLYHALGLEYVHGDPNHAELEAQMRLFAGFLLKPYKELCESSAAFLRGGNFYLPGNEEAIRSLNRFREAVERFEYAQRENKE